MANTEEFEKLILHFRATFSIVNKQILFGVIPSLIAFLLIGSSIAAATPLSSQSGTISST
jgi:hypothetical protein